MIQGFVYWMFKLYVIDCVIEKTIGLAKQYIYNQVFQQRILNDLSNSLNTIAPSRKANLK
jgi:hypothetical protein